MHYPPRDPRLINPLAIAAQQSDPRFLLAAQAIERAVQARHQQPLDGGAAAFDVLAQRMAGLQLNLSGFRKDPELTYPLAPDVSYQLKTANAKNGGIGGQVEYITLNQVPMADWDIPSDAHAARNVTVRHLGDVEELIRDHLKRNPQSSLRLYQTPGGFRAWDLSQSMDPIAYSDQSQAMHVDGDYIRLAQDKAPVTVEGLTYGGPGFASRISAKPGRPHDWVAQPLVTLAGNEAIPNPVNRRLVRLFHDEPIRQHYLNGGAAPEALAMVKEQAKTASPALQRLLSAARML